MPHVDAIGSHPSEFFTHLKAANYTYTIYKTYSEFRLNLEEPPAALAVCGRDVALESTEAILNVLKSNVILLLFSPSVDLLRLLKSAIKTSTELHKIELEDGVPLIVYKLHGIDRYHLVPGFLKFNPSSAQTDVEEASRIQDPSPSELLQYSIKLIARCKSHASDFAAHRELSVVHAANTLATTLIPPLTTCYWKLESFTATGSYTEQGVTYDVYWPVDVYAYAADLPPPASRVYTVVKYGGQFSVSAPWKHRAGDYHIASYKVSDGKKLLQNYFQSPQSGTQNGASTTYDVILDESLTLFEGVSCDNPFVHNLSYSERYVRTNYVVQTSTPGAYEHRFDLTEVLPFTHLSDGNHETLATTTYDIRGIVMFRSTVGSSSLNFEAEMRQVKATQTLDLDLTFN